MPLSFYEAKAGAKFQSVSEPRLHSDKTSAGAIPSAFDGRVFAVLREVSIILAGAKKMAAR